MCYDISVNLRRQLKEAMRVNDETIIAEINAKIDKLETPRHFHTSGFSHPEILVYTNENPAVPVLSQWGLIPHWSKSEKDAKKFWNNTLNARGETVFDKPSFSDSAKFKRCLIYVDGFFEHHHLGGNTYPFLIQRKDRKMTCLGGIWSEWVNKETGEVLNTFSIITTKGNDAFSIIHNNPKMTQPRMPLVLHGESEDEWLHLDAEDKLDRERINELMTAYPSDDFEYVPVGKLRGKDAVGNSEYVLGKMHYPELWLTLNELSAID
ncbi:MAG: SOS response-associated peptidase [Crocinitomicaceae bacterium]|nr:SOS response-associated peptidase [Crocinitomicaceae bacterium]